MTAGILFRARILRAAPLPKEVRTSAVRRMSSAMSVLPCGPLGPDLLSTRTHVSLRKDPCVAHCAQFHRVDHGCGASLAEVPAKLTGPRMGARPAGSGSVELAGVHPIEELLAVEEAAGVLGED